MRSKKEKNITRDQAIQAVLSDMLKKPNFFFSEIKNEMQSIDEKEPNINKLSNDLLYRKAVVAVVSRKIKETYPKAQAQAGEYLLINYGINYGEISSKPTGEKLLQKLAKAKEKEEKNFLASKSLYLDDRHNTYAIQNICKDIMDEAKTKESLLSNKDYILDSIFKHVNQARDNARKVYYPLSDQSAFSESELGKNLYLAVKKELEKNQLLDQVDAQKIRFSSTAEEDAKELVLNFLFKDNLFLKKNNELRDQAKCNNFQDPGGLCQFLLNALITSLAESPLESSELEAIVNILDAKNQNGIQENSVAIKNLAKSAIFDFLAAKHEEGSDHKKYFTDKKNQAAYFQTEIGQGQLERFKKYYRDKKKEQSTNNRAAVTDPSVETPKTPRSTTRRAQNI